MGALREVYEETGLEAKYLHKIGKVDFFFGPGKTPDWVVYVFYSSCFSGELVPSEEGRLEWFKISDIPYDDMWEDDRYWLPLMFEDKEFSGIFHYDEGELNLIRYTLSIISDED